MKTKFKPKFCQHCGQKLPASGVPVTNELLDDLDKQNDQNTVSIKEDGVEATFVRTEPEPLFRKKKAGDDKVELQRRTITVDEPSLDDAGFLEINPDDPDLVKKEKKRLNAERKMEQKRLAMIEEKDPDQTQTEVVQDAQGRKVRIASTSASIDTETPEGFGGRPNNDDMQQRYKDKMAARGIKVKIAGDGNSEVVQIEDDSLGTVEKFPTNKTESNIGDGKPIRQAPVVDSKIPIRKGQTLDNIDFE